MKLGLGAAGWLAAVGVVVGWAALTVGGPLTPPSGPVAGSMRTLAEVEPRTPLSAATTPGNVSNVFVIAQPGSYYLTGNVQTSANRNGILVSADNVTIDLNGFAIDGSTDTTGFRSGISNSAPRRNLTVRNGTIRNMRGYGVLGTFNSSCFEDMAFIDNLSGQLEIAPSSNCTVRNVRLRTPSGETGIQLGENCVVEHCTVEGGTVAILVLSGVVRGCSVVDPGAVGISLGAGEVIDCYVEGANNTSSGSYAGISVGSGSLVRGCSVKSCASQGVYLSGRGTVRECTFFNCAKGVTVPLAGRGVIEACQFGQTPVGVLLQGPGSMVVGNRFGASATPISAVAGNTVGEVIDTTAGATLTAANSHVMANVVH